MGTKASRKNFYNWNTKKPGNVFCPFFSFVALEWRFFRDSGLLEPSMRITGVCVF